MAAGRNFAQRLLETFLTGFGIAAGVSLFVMPMTSRTMVSKQMGGMVGLLKIALSAHGRYMRSVSDGHYNAIYAPTTLHEDKPENQHHKFHFPHLHDKDRGGDAQRAATLSQEAKAMKQALVQLGALYGKIQIEVGFAKKEMAYGHLRPCDFSRIAFLMRGILLPIIGFTTFIDILQSVKDKKDSHMSKLSSEDTIEAVKRLEIEDWEDVMAMSHEHYKALNVAMQDGLTHVSHVLQLAKKPKGGQKDVEKDVKKTGPGEAGFAEYLEGEIHKFYIHREEVLKSWCERKGIAPPSTFWDDNHQEHSAKGQTLSTDAGRQRSNQQQLYLILYVEFLTWSIGKSILKMVRFADSKVEDGTMKKIHLIIPAWRRLRKWCMSVFKQSDDHGGGIDDFEMGDGNVWIGDSLKAKKDPEHLPPSNFLEKTTDWIRTIPAFLQSAEAAFAFRVAVATMSVGILTYLRQTQAFFLRQRGLWSLIMVAISMSVHAGQSIFNFGLRILGTFVAVVFSIAIWYMADEKTAAIIPLQYIYLCLGFWFVFRNPKIVVVGVISMVTVVMVIGYELQVRKIGEQLATSNGQPYYPIYELAPYRLAAVAAGLAVAFFWTYFPYPVTTHTTLRKDLGKTLYLLANYYSCVHTTVDMRLHLGSKIDETKKRSPGARLDKARNKVFAKIAILMNVLREDSSLTRMEPTFGGKFPKETYDDLIQHVQNLFNYISIISYSTITFTTDPSAEESGWLQSFRRFMGNLQITSHEMTSTLCLLSASLTNSQPLPPYLNLPKAYDFRDRMEAVDPEILSIKHVAEPCYAAFAVLQIAGCLITEEMDYVVKRVQELVGEVDFSFHIVSTRSDASSTTETLMGDGNTVKNGKKDS